MNSNVNLNEVIEVIETLGFKWGQAGMNEGKIVSEIIVQHLKEKFIKEALENSLKQRSK